MKETMVERDIQMLERAVESFKQRAGRLPTSLRELIRRGLLPALPEEPFGGVYRFDPATGAITSSTHPERLRVYSPAEAVNQR